MIRKPVQTDRASMNTNRICEYEPDLNRNRNLQTVSVCE